MVPFLPIGFLCVAWTLRGRRWRREALVGLFALHAVFSTGFWLTHRPDVVRRDALWSVVDAVAARTAEVSAHRLAGPVRQMVMVGLDRQVPEVSEAELSASPWVVSGIAELPGFRHVAGADGLHLFSRRGSGAP